jgi:hypothetical protein
MDIESIPNNFWLQDSPLIEPFNAVMTDFLATAIFARQRKSNNII